MPSADPTQASGAVRPPKQTTKIRHSITLSSVSKALADVMNKDGGKLNSPEKVARKKDASSRPSRTSAMGAASRSSLDVLPVKTESPELRTVARQTRSSTRAALALSEKESAKVADISNDMLLTRNNDLKAKQNDSGLPKLRPRSVEPYAKGPTPPLVGIRRQVNGPPKENVQERPSSSSDSTPRASSPRLKKVVKQHTRAASDISLQTLRKESTPSSKLRSSPDKDGLFLANPSKTPATVPPGTAPPPPSSSASNSSSGTPVTPTRKHAVSAVPPRNNLRLPPSPLQQSPLDKSTPKGSSTTSSDSTPPPDTPEQIEGDSYDSIDVEFMLGTVVSPTAPTPAVPRMKASRSKAEQMDPTTPTRPTNFLPSRSNLSYLSPIPADDSPPSLRPKPKQPGQDRGSLLSWEQLAAHTSINEDVDVEHMLSEISAPFRSGAISPTSSTFDGLDSPTLTATALSSPAGYQSISRVLLPDVTPSPALPRMVQFDRSPSNSSGDAALATLLRLQLASSESIAKDRLQQMQSLEEQLHTAKQARIQEAEELAKQVSDLEAQLRCSLEAREKMNDDRIAYTASLETQLKKLVSSRQHDVETAVVQTKAHCDKVHDVAVTTARRRWDVACMGQQAASSWAVVRSLTEGQLELVRSNRESIPIILSGLDHELQRLRSQL